MNLTRPHLRKNLETFPYLFSVWRNESWRDFTFLFLAKLCFQLHMTSGTLISHITEFWALFTVNSVESEFVPSIRRHKQCRHKSCLLEWAHPHRDTQTHVFPATFSKLLTAWSLCYRAVCVRSLEDFLQAVSALDKCLSLLFTFHSRSFYGKCHFIMSFELEIKK